MLQGMGRTPEAGVSRDAKVTVRFTAAETQQLDSRRGVSSRSTYIRALVRDDSEEDDG